MSITKQFLRCSISCLILLSIIFALSCKPAGGIAVIETEYGKIKIKFAPDVAPRHVEHFIKLARAGFYDGLAFHRADTGLLIQGGDPQTRNGDPSLWGMGMPEQETVAAEFSSRPFVRGTVGMARTREIDSASSQFFICLRDMERWNGQYTVFGEVVEGIDIVELISKMPTTGPPFDRLLEKVVMKRVYIENSKN
jgi:peptidyl-prolyl cis-trans isomerase B (cyclophilin B)